jgi:hypothetical protein
MGSCKRFRPQPIRATTVVADFWTFNYSVVNKVITGPNLQVKWT